MTRSALKILVGAVLAAPVFSQALPPPPPPPIGNPKTPAKALLGKALFWDEQVSSSGTVACGSCHIPARGGSDPRSSALDLASRHPGFDGILGTPDDVTGSPGISRQDFTGAYLLAPTFRLLPQVTPRKTPPFINSAYVPELFWDGRARGAFTDPLTGAVLLPNGAALESQAAGPPVSEVEMGHVGRDWTAVATKVAQSRALRLAPSLSPDLQSWLAGRDYPQLFQEAFGTPGVTPARIAMAIATYERTQFSNQAPIDAFLSGNPNALTAQELQGRGIFNGVGGCINCHAGALFSNNTFHYIGVRPQNEDLGRFAVTGNPGDRGSFKVPSLRNVELRAPYFHNGGKATLEDVVEFYNNGGDFDAPNKSPLVHPLNLTTTQKAALVAFMKRPMTDVRVAQELPPFDHPSLYAASSLVPSHFGFGTTGGSGATPTIVALDPPVIGSDGMTIGVDRSLPGRFAVLIVDSQSVPGGTPFSGATLFVPITPRSVMIRIPALSGSGVGGGWGSVTLPIPNDPLLIGTTLNAQWIVFDNSPIQRYAASDAVQWTHF